MSSTHSTQAHDIVTTVFLLCTCANNKTRVLISKSGSNKEGAGKQSTGPGRVGSCKCCLFPWAQHLANSPRRRGMQKQTRQPGSSSRIQRHCGEGTGRPANRADTCEGPCLDSLGGPALRLVPQQSGVTRNVRQTTLCTLYLQLS